MILEQKVLTKITSKNYKHYESYGYKPVYYVDKEGVERLKQTIIEVDVHQLPKSSHAMIKVACDICGHVKEAEYRHTLKRKSTVCSDSCFSKLREKRAIENIESKFNLKFEDFLRLRYIEQKKTIRMIAKELFGKETNHSTINYWLKKFDIPLRRGSDAIKTQWINADSRRKLSSELAHKNLNNKETRNKLHKIMLTDEYKEKSRIAKLGENNPMFGVRGDAHPNWNPELTDEDRIRERKTFEDSQWRLEVYRRDKFRCQKCGRNKDLNAHHILNHKTHKQLRHNADNGITFCEPCHIMFHKTYGYFNNNRKQINEYMNL